MATARDQGLRLSETLEFAFRHRYRLPPTDPRFLDATLEMMLIDHWAWRHWEDPKLRDEIVAEGYDDDIEQMEQEAALREAVRAAKVAAVLADDWEDVP